MDRTATGFLMVPSSCRVSVTSCIHVVVAWLCCWSVSVVRVPPVLGGDDEGHGRREGPTGGLEE